MTDTMKISEPYTKHLQESEEKKKWSFNILLKWYETNKTCSF